MPKLNCFCGQLAGRLPLRRETHPGQLSRWLCRRIGGRAPARQLFLLYLVYSFVVAAQACALGRAGYFGVLGWFVDATVVGVRARLVVAGVVDGGSMVVHKNLKIGQFGVVNDVFYALAWLPNRLCSALKGV